MAIAEVTGVKDPPVVGGWSQVGWSKMVGHRWSYTSGQSQVVGDRLSVTGGQQ